MCFKNLPIEFDSNGKARLLESAGDPYGTKNSPIKQHVRPEASNSDGSGASTAPPRMRGWTTT